MPKIEKEELHVWEQKHIDGSGLYATSDWPGWEKYIGKKPFPVDKKVEKFGYVYLVRLSSGECKIGKSMTVARRVSDLQTANPKKIDLLHFFPAADALKVEASLHRAFAHKKISNEWFTLNDEEIRRFCSIQEYMEDELKISSQGGNSDDEFARDK